jgi:hypothetical protein
VICFILSKFFTLQSFKKPIQGKNLKFIKPKDLNFGLGQTTEIYNFDNLFYYLLKSNKSEEPMSIQTTIAGAGKIF